jgi:hypothetical protein
LVVPLEERGRIVGGNTTPKFAQMVSWKYAQLPASKVEEDLLLNHARPVSRKLVQRLGKHVGEIALDKEFKWAYELPEFEDVVKHVAISRDGTTTAILGEGYRETMCGTISFYNSKGERMHTIYTACAPEHGKESFDKVMDMEIERVKQIYPKVNYVGLADGAKDNWSYLQSHTSEEILDFFHASEHLGDVSKVVKKDPQASKAWLEEACHDLKNKPKGAQLLLRELKHLNETYSGKAPEVLSQTITYFENNHHRMQYVKYQKMGYPIGSGVTEAACKVVVKQRLNGSGMRWHLEPVQHMLLLRGLIYTAGRWQQFWQHFDKNGL